MENIKNLIDIIEHQIEQLGRDVHYVNNDVSIRTLQQAIQNRHDRIAELKEEYNL